MELKYRGISYDYRPIDIEWEETVLFLVFLGKHYNLRRPFNLECQPYGIDGHFRGRPYQIPYFSLC
ncbi:DUF4278 domain-containing protein [Acaryochloris sp. IP29b_bin.148]|uniref:DUF4278 domain-containing protein n=1 Tax=Acaryochloris sp. IP29b_bin.148 TaxID=2969218 RepID=UPI00345268C9